MNKRNITGINIKNNCPMNWSKMPSVGSDKNCLDCQKMVIDFSILSEREIIQYFENPKSKGTCGRLTKTQIKSINTNLNKNRKSNIKNFVHSILIATTLTAVGCSSSKSIVTEPIYHYKSDFEILNKGINQDSINTILVKGIIVDENENPIFGVTLVSNSEKPIGTQTNEQGAFEIQLPVNNVNATHLSTGYIGYEDFKINLNQVKNKEIKVTLAEEIFIIGEVITRQPLHSRIWNGIKNIFS